MKQTAIFLAAWIFFPGLVFPLLAQDGLPAAAQGVKISFFNSFVVQQSPEGGTSSDIYTVQDQSKGANSVFRLPPGSKKDTPQLPLTDLVYVAPGGLEPGTAPGYSFGWEDQLGDKYRVGSFSFSGRADGLVFRPKIGWGTENLNGDFIPGLILNSYEQKDEPYVSILWERDREHAHRPNDDIYLNYSFKVPKNSEVTWGTDNFLTRYTFAGTFSARAPEVKKQAVYRWRRGTVQVFSQQLKTPPSPLVRSFPQGMPVLSGFAFSNDCALFYAASADGTIMAAKSNGDTAWTAQGRTPIIPCRNYLFAVAPDYRSIILLDAGTGQSIASCALPKFLPRDDNSFALAEGEKATWLFLNIPAQSRLLCYMISLPPAPTIQDPAPPQLTVDVKTALPPPATEKKGAGSGKSADKASGSMDNPLLEDDDEYDD
ncbi:MAG: hypothetical protein A2X49_03855 [Lentisphaerae bacterium GWF2_52_8]|nr:MAG: hypothetical protein A2X49_03855 [Lentisphaerae bacterium GWF2_52_8]